MEEVFTFKKIYKSYLDCRKLKRNTVNAVSFEYDLERNLFNLLDGLKKGSYFPGRSICFVVTDPVYREIFAADFKDRVVHHLLIRELEKYGERKFIFNSFSCRKGKGTHLGVLRLKKAVQNRNYRKKLYYLQMDIAGFFMSMDKKILYAILKKLVLKQKKSKQWKRGVLWLSKTIIFHKPVENFIKKGDRSLFSLVPSRKSLFNSKEGTGMPIGNYSSQFFANLYLDQLDQFVKRRLKCKHYFRYVDDFILLSEDKEKLKEWRDKIESFLSEFLNLKVSHKKTRTQSVEKGIDFLGYFINPDYTLVRQRVVKSLKDKIYMAKRKSVKEEESGNNKEKLIATINSYLGHFKHADSIRLRESVCRYSYYKFDVVYTKAFDKVNDKKKKPKENINREKKPFKRKRKMRKKKNIQKGDAEGGVSLLVPDDTRTSGTVRGRRGFWPCTILYRASPLYHSIQDRAPFDTGPGTIRYRTLRGFSLF